MIKQNDVVRIYPQQLKDGEMVVYLALRDGRKYCLAVESWHVDYEGLISYPAIHGHGDDWLESCGYQSLYGHYPSTELLAMLEDILRENEGEILDHLQSEDGISDKEFWGDRISATR